jgi:hypothetical protein
MLEVFRCISELDATSRALDATSFLPPSLLPSPSLPLQHLDIKVEYESVVIQIHGVEQQMAVAAKAGFPAKGTSQQQQQELKSMLHVSETAVREARTKMQGKYEGLLDAEALLNRAVELKKQQDRLAPLFLLIFRNSTKHSDAADDARWRLPTACRLNAMVVSAALLMRGPFELKYAFLLRLFHTPQTVLRGTQAIGLCSIFLWSNESPAHRKNFLRRFLILFLSTHSVLTLSSLPSPPSLPTHSVLTEVPWPTLIKNNHI